MRRCLSSIRLVLLVLTGLVLLHVGAVARCADQGMEKLVTPFLKTNCLRCHGDQKKEGSLHLGKLGNPRDKADLERWQTVVERMSQNEMPPEEEPQPKPDDKAAVLKWLQQQLQNAGR
jgi:mono/diheme cytochrome c family protein